MNSDSTQRFSDRVDAYVRYRPGYPDELIDLLKEEIGLAEGSVIADVGSGTGISSDLFLRRGMTVYAVEPNGKMREAAERMLEGNPLFHSLEGTAERTGLPDGSVDLVAAGQAFHWFDRERARSEFRRILKPGGHVLLFWNSRRTEGTPFLESYEGLLQQYGTDYNTINHQNIDDRIIGEFFSPDSFVKRTLYNEQVTDFDGAQGRLVSSSYVPNVNDPQYEPMLRDMRRIFDEHARNGTVRFEYDLVIYYGKLSQRG